MWLLVLLTVVWLLNMSKAGRQLRRGLIPFLWMWCMLLCMAGCSDDEKEEIVVPYLETATSTYDDITAAESTLTISVKSNIGWTVESDKPWCSVLSANTGSGDADIQLKIAENLTQNAREASIKLASADATLAVTVSIRQAVPVFVAGGRYKIPVVFQVLYANKNDEKQYVRAGHLQDVIDGVNKLYRESGQELNLEFVMATEDPEGNVMEEPGVNRVAWTTGKMNCEEFMSSREKRHLDLIWDPDRYINIMLYTFTASNILGIAQFPFTVYPDELPGCTAWKGGVPVQENLNRPQCVSINNAYIYDIGATLSPATPEGTDTYVIGTLAHELGHYLGLRHVFSEAISGCSDTDFCSDTGTYDREAYLRKLQSYGNDYLLHLDELVMRRDCVRGNDFTSDNIMDYAISYFNAFSLQQTERIRYILEHGAFIPGPKDRKNSTQTRAAGMLDLPMEIVK